MQKIKQIFNEYVILNNLNHPNIIKCIVIYHGDRKHEPAILLEYCKNNLEDSILSHKFNNIHCIGIIYEICAAMKYIHENKIIHRDLKMKNILIKKNHPKICDFGISKVLDLTTISTITHNIGTLLFMAPEIFDTKIIYDEKVDVYAFGVVMYFILTKGKIPEFSGLGNLQSTVFPPEINILSQSIIKNCWALTPQQRPSFQNLIDLIIDNNFLLIDGIENEIPKIRTFLKLD